MFIRDTWCEGAKNLTSSDLFVCEGCERGVGPGVHRDVVAVVCGSFGLVGPSVDIGTDEVERCFLVVLSQEL